MAQHPHDPELDKPEEELREDYRQIADRRVRLGLVLSEIGQRNEIQVTQDELNRAVFNEARRYPGQEQQVFEFFKKQPQAIEGLRAPIYEDKVVDFHPRKGEGRGQARLGRGTDARPRRGTGDRGRRVRREAGQEGRVEEGRRREEGGAEEGRG